MRTATSSSTPASEHERRGRHLSVTAHPTSWIAPGAVVLGDVTVGADASIWYGCVVRGDEEPIEIGEATNLQDGVIVHTTRGWAPTVVADRVVVGHGAVLHSARIDSGALVGIRAVVLDGAHVREGAFVAAGAVVSPRVVVPPGQLWAGVPARHVRDVTDDDRALQAWAVDEYVDRVRRSVSVRRA
jgi:carbonic anhydrase/acetyltransferase-like protein (isoleucine patch superfamily)